MKYMMIIADGMADERLLELHGKTPLCYASTKTLDRLARRSEIGFVRTVPSGMQAGSDVAGLTILGYDPLKYYTGRAPLELLGLVPQKQENFCLGKGDYAYRMNLVTLSEEEPFEKKRMLDHTAGQISTKESKEIMKNMQNLFDRMAYQYYTETSYRHLLVGRQMGIEGLIPPHDILEKTIEPYLPKEKKLRLFMEESYRILNDCSINEERRKQGKRPANSIWVWGGGEELQLENFFTKYEKRGAMISAVAVFRGIANGSGMTNLTVQGATGTVDTNYGEKAKRAIEALLYAPYDFVCLHVEAPDEASHRGDLQGKIHAIEQIDQKIIQPIVEAVEKSEEEVRILILPDHYTFVRTKVHGNLPVPYLLYDSRRSIGSFLAYNEVQADSGNVISNGIRLIEKLFSE